MAGLLRPFCTIAEAETFARVVASVFSEAEYASLVDHLATKPEAGVLIQGGGGLRKLRWKRSNSGKRGGARVIYFYRTEGHIILLLGAYAKSDKADLTEDEKAQFRKIAEEFR
jgi:hypothetical protein